MPIPALAVAGGSLLFKGLSSFFGHKSKTKANKEQRRAQIAALTLQQKQREDARRARVDAASSLLGRVPATTAGGGVNTNVALDPELVKRLSTERTYDFSSAVPDENVGAGSAFLSGLFGGVGDLGAYLYDQQHAGAEGAGGGGQLQGLSFDELKRLQKTQRGGGYPGGPSPSPTDAEF